MNPRAQRVTRGWFVAASATVMASLSHVVGGGQAPGALAIVLALAFSGLVCMALVSPRAGMVRVGAGAVFAQLALHALYSVSSPANGVVAANVASQSGLGAHAGHNLDLVSIFASQSAAAGHSHASWPMLVSHLGAAVLTVVALRRGDRAITALVRTALLAVRAAFAPLVVVAIERMPRLRLDAPESLARPGLVVLAPDRLRGPPAASVV